MIKQATYGLQFSQIAERSFAFAAQYWFAALLLICVPLCVVPRLSHAQTALPVNVTQHDTVEGITEYRLNNGLSILLLPDDTKPLTTVNVTYRVGSMHENYGETGMAHLLEHLLFKGTPSILDLSEQMNKRGFRMNGTTYYDRTNYYETFSANDAYLDWALRMEADRMVNSLIAKKDLDSEMNVVWDELRRGENNPGRVLSQRMMAAAFDFHSYGKPTIGAPSDLENVSIEKLQAFYKLYYQPDNAVLTVAGRFDPTKTLALIAQVFGSIAKPSRTLPKLYTLEPTQDGERRVIVRRVGDTTQISAQYHLPAASHPDHAALAVLGNVLGTEPTGIFFKALNEQRLAAQTYAGVNALAQRSVFLVGAQLEGTQSLEAAEAALLKATESIVALTEDGLKRAQQEYEAGFSPLLKSPEGMAVALSESIGHGDWRLLFAQREAVKKVTTSDIVRVAQRYLKPENRTVGVFMPTAQPNRADIPVVANPKAVADATTFAAPQQAGEKFDPTPAALEARTTRGRLSSGIPLVTLRKQNRGNSVSLRIQLNWGDLTSLNAAHKTNQRVSAASWVGAMMLEGSQGQNKATLTDSLAALKSSLDIQSSPAGATISIASEQQHLLAVLRLLEPVLKRPLFQAADLDRLRSTQLASLAAQSQNPESRTAQTIAQRSNIDRGVPPDDWRYKPTTEQSIAHTKALSIAQVRQAYTDFWTSKHAVISVVGTLPDGLESALENLLSDWSASPAAAAQTYTRQAKPAYANAPHAEQIQLNDKTNAVYSVQANFSMQRSDPAYWPLQIGSHILGGDAFTSRIGKRVRVTEGLSYSAGSYINVDTRDDRAVYAAYASFAPKNLAKVQTAIREEMVNLLKNGITAQELTDAQAYLLQSIEQQRASDSYLVSHLLLQTELGLNFDVHSQHRERIQNATVASVNAALRQYFNPLKMIEVSAGDWTK